MKNIYLILYIIILFGCNKNTKEYDSINLINILNNKSTSIPLSNIYESELRIPLETSDSILIKYIWDIVVDNNLIYIEHDNRCSVFDKSGKYLRKIGNRGQGPEEYISITKIFTTDNKVLIHDSNKNKILIYDQKGKFINSINIPLKFLNIKQLENNNFIGYIPNVTGHESIKFGIFNKDGLLLDSIPHNIQFEPKFTLWFTDEGKFFHYNQNTYFKEYLNDTIYQVKNDKLHPYLHFELGDQRARNLARAELIGYSRNDTFFPNMAKVNIIGETNRFVFLRAKGFICYDKINKTCNKIDSKYNDSELNPIAVSNDNKYLITYRNRDNEENPEVILLKVKE